MNDTYIAEEVQCGMIQQHLNSFMRWTIVSHGDTLNPQWDSWPTQYTGCVLKIWVFYLLMFHLFIE